VKRYVFIDGGGNINSIIGWVDDRELPPDYIIPTGCIVKTINDDSIDIYNTYDAVSDNFYIVDITDKELQISDIKNQLSILDLVLSRFQEDTWTVLNVDETKLPQIWQGRLKQKRDLREQLRLLV